MFIQVKRLLNNSADRWNNIPALVRYEAELSANLKTIREILDDGTRDTRPSTENKQEKKQEVSTRAAILAGAMVSYGAETGNKELQGMSEYPAYKLNRMHDSDFAPTVRQITKMANDHLDGLADQGVTQEEIDSILAITQDFEDLLGGARSISTENVGNKAALQQTIDDTNALIKQKLDNSMLRFTLQDPIFFQQYEMARTIVDK